VTSVQAVYIPADDVTDPAITATFSHLDVISVLSRRIFSLGLYPAIDPLQSSSTLLKPEIVGRKHYETATQVKATLARYEELQDLIAILGMEELSQSDQQVVIRARRIQRFLTQPFFTAGAYVGQEGRYVPVEDTIDGFARILSGEFDDLPEQAFYMSGKIDEVIAKAKAMEREQAE